MNSSANRITFLLTWVVVSTVVTHFLKPGLGTNSSSRGEVGVYEEELSSICFNLEAFAKQSKQATCKISLRSVFVRYKDTTQHKHVL